MTPDSSGESTDGGDPGSSEGSDGSPIAESQSTDSGESESSEGSDTTSTARRHWLTNDGIAWTLTASMTLLIILHGIDWIDLTGIPEPFRLVYIGAFGTAIAWAFGKDAIEAWRGGSK